LSIFSFVSIFSIILSIEGHGLPFYLESPLKSSIFPAILLGGILSVVFYGAMHMGWIQNPLVVRYFGSHPIEYIITMMFFVGVAILLVKFQAIYFQRQLLQKSPILPPHPQFLPVTHAESDLETVGEHERQHGASLLTERMKVHLRSVLRSNSASNLDTELRSRAEAFAAKADAEYGLTRSILWAIPMIGFLGTVIGITMALDNLDLNTINESSKKLSAGLAVAFDTTGLAIALAVVLFFVQFLVHREETSLLSETDRLTEAELCGRFEQNDLPKDNESIVTVRRMLEVIIDYLEQATTRQTGAWEQCLTTVNHRYAKLTEQSAETLKISLASALSESMEHHAKSLVQAESELLSQANRTTIQFNEAFSKSAASMLALREETVKQTETVREILGANSQLLQLEERLKENLSMLSNIGNFEETVNSLAAAIHLLNSNRRSELRAG